MKLARKLTQVYCPCVTSLMLLRVRLNLLLMSDINVLPAQSDECLTCMNFDAQLDALVDAQRSTSA